MSGVLLGLGGGCFGGAARVPVALVLLVIHLVFSKQVIFFLPVLNCWIPSSNVEEFGIVWVSLVASGVRALLAGTALPGLSWAGLIGVALHCFCSCFEALFELPGTLWCAQLLHGLLPAFLLHLV